MLVGFEAYQESWVEEFRVAASALRRAVGDAVLRIDHIGSTAVPGLAAKPVIDMQLTLSALSDHTALIGPLTGLGYIYRSDIGKDRPPPWETDDPAQWSKAYFRTPDGVAPRHHIHVREEGRRNQRYPLLMRDFLRSSARARGSYATFKSSVAEAVGHLSSGGGTGLYVDLKDPVFDLIADAAEQWAVQAGWSAGVRDA